MGVGIGECRRIQRTALHRGRRLAGRQCLLGGSKLFHGAAEAAACAHAPAFPVVQIYRGVAASENLVLRQEPGDIGNRVPLFHVSDDCRVLEHLRADVFVDLRVSKRQERQREDHPGRVLARVIEVADRGAFEGVDLQAVEVLRRF